MCVQSLSQFAVMVFHSMTFVNNETLPSDFSQGRFVLHDVLISCNENIELVRSNLVAQSTPVLGVALISYDVDRGSPFFEFAQPVGEGGKGNDDQVRAIDAFDLHQITHKCDRLDSFT